MVRSCRTSLAVAGLLACASVATACLWDSDTIQMERARFPSTLELITGKFLRHSPEFYEWRIRDRLAKLEREPKNLAWLDDLAVAYDKTGQHDDAVRIAERADTIQPNRYETLANLGTFHIHAGRLEQGLTYIDRAIAINPDAHFGREIYQKKLVEYVLSRRQGSELILPLAAKRNDTPVDGEERTVTGRVNVTFATFLNLTDPLPSDRKARIEAIQGVQGMMKFGKHDSPVLLEALGWLLLIDASDRTQLDAKLLASRAFLKAEYEAKSPVAKEGYRALARSALGGQVTKTYPITPATLADIEAEFSTELAEARTWYEALRKQELTWIQNGDDVEAEFNRLYQEEPAIVSTGPIAVLTTTRNYPMQNPFLVCIVLGIALLGVFLKRFRHAKDITLSPATPSPGSRPFSDRPA